MSTGTAQFDLLPAETLIADRRNASSAAAVEAAPTLRIAAAEVVREGYLLHYGEPRWYDVPDRDLALLAGDRMYAAGLAALAEEGDTVAVSALAALIAGCAEAHAVNDSARAAELWESTLAMLAPGSD
ncbi:MAG: hypothetical protein ACRDKE_01890 [Solirubrobacterales bacterium]